MIPSKLKSPPKYFARGMSAIGGMLLLSSCSSAPDVTQTLNPGSWVGGWFETEQASAAERERTAIPGEDEDYRRLTIAEQPFSGDIRRDYEGVVNALVADRRLASYTDQEIRKTVPPVSRVPVSDRGGDSLDLPDDGGAAEALANQLPDSQRPDNSVENIPSSGEISEDSAIERAQSEDGVQQAARATPSDQASEPENSRGSSQPVRSQTRDSQTRDSDFAVLTNRSLPQVEALGTPRLAIGNNGRLLATLFYPQNTIELPSEDNEIFDEIIRFYQDYEVSQLYIIGHASQSDAEGFTSGMLSTYKLALDRAIQVGERLIARGLSRDTIQIDGRGANQPLYSEATPNGAIGNRRVEVYVEF